VRLAQDSKRRKQKIAIIPPGHEQGAPGKKLRAFMPPALPT
jgi:hypothetical protein